MRYLSQAKSFFFFLAFWLLLQDTVDLAQHWHGMAGEQHAQGCMEPTAQAMRYQAQPRPQTPENAISWGLITYYF